jgi:hypothetical protein
MASRYGTLFATQYFLIWLRYRHGWVQNPLISLTVDNTSNAYSGLFPESGGTL